MERNLRTWQMRSNALYVKALKLYINYQKTSVLIFNGASLDNLTIFDKKP